MRTLTLLASLLISTSCVPGAIARGERQPSGSRVALPDLGAAPELVGIDGWINGGPHTLAQLRGRVVIVKFWTFACFNCRNTLPATQAWYERYREQGLEIIAVHSPELEFERRRANIEDAVRKAGIQYPVALDSRFATWKAYDNHYWPAWYVVDARGHIRYRHIGEGGYDETDRVVRQLLDEVRLSGDDHRSRGAASASR